MHFALLPALLALLVTPSLVEAQTLQRINSNTSSLGIPCNLDNSGELHSVYVFDSSDTTWLYHPSSGWSRISTSSVRNMVCADVDGDGAEEIVASFHDNMPPGLFIYDYQSGAWTRIPSAPIFGFGVVDDRDNDGAEDVPVRFEDGGTWMLWGENLTPPGPLPKPTVSSSVQPAFYDDYNITWTHHQERTQLTRFEVAIWSTQRTINYMPATIYNADSDPELTCSSSSCTLNTPAVLVPGTFLVDVTPVTSEEDGPTGTATFTVYDR